MLEEFVKAGGGSVNNPGTHEEKKDDRKDKSIFEKMKEKLTGEKEMKE